MVHIFFICLLAIVLKRNLFFSYTRSTVSAGIMNWNSVGKSECSEFFDRIRKCLEAPHINQQQLTHKMLHQQIGWNGTERKKSMAHFNYRIHIPDKSHANVKPVPKAQYTPASSGYRYPYRSDRKTIQQELYPLVPLYNTYAPFHLTLEATPNPAIPEFRNEFADIKLPIEKPRQDIPPPPARTNGLKFFCKFCKKNGEHPQKYMSHSLFNDNELVCPILATHLCDNCHKIGHTR